MNYTTLTKLLTNIRDKNPEKIFWEMLKILEFRKNTDWETLDNRNFPLIKAVAQGGGKEPIVLLLNKSKLKTAEHILIGKGIVFDSGGVQSKGDYMDDMFFDKAGATTAFAYAIKNKNVPTLIFLTNNMNGPDSYVPHEIIKSKSGKRVLISHTDAEGRLGLADLLTYAQTHNKKANKVTLATLTGAAVSFTGENTYALVHSDNKKVLTNVLKASLNQKLKLWPAPTHKKYNNAIKTTVLDADMQTCGEMNGAGSQTAYSFLKRFAKKVTHIDMAAMASIEHNATGWGIKELDFIFKKGFK